MAELQAELLARAAAWLKPGGTLVYATCSLEQAEGEDQVARFLDARPDFGPLPAMPAELPDGIAPTAQGWVRRSEEHKSELQSLMRISYAVFSLKKKHSERPTH